MLFRSRKRQRRRAVGRKSVSAGWLAWRQRRVVAVARERWDHCRPSSGGPRWRVERLEMIDWWRGEGPLTLHAFYLGPTPSFLPCASLSSSLSLSQLALSNICLSPLLSTPLSPSSLSLSLSLFLSLCLSLFPLFLSLSNKGYSGSIDLGVAQSSVHQVYPRAHSMTAWPY